MTTMRAWQFKNASGGIEKKLFLTPGGIPKPKISDNEILVEVHSAALNPVDYKVPEIGLAARVFIPSPSIPGMDFCGTVAAVGSQVSSYTVGQAVFGAKGESFGNGSLAEYVAVAKDMVAALPDGVRVDDAAGVGVVALTAMQAIQPYVKAGDKIFINGGSGGTGVMAIQVAKALGCHVTTSCSTASIQLCKSLGADEVIDYRSNDLVSTLKKGGLRFSLVVDNVGSPFNLYKSSRNFLLSNGNFVQVAGGVGLYSIAQTTSNKLLPHFLGGGHGTYRTMLAHSDATMLEQLARWMQNGKVRPVTDSVFDFEDVPKAFEKLKTGRAKGKIVIHVKSSLETLDLR